MFKNSSKILFFITLISGTFLTISSNSWLSAWMGLEINLLSFIPLMIDNNNLMSNEASLKYFLIQAIASSILLFSIILSMMKFNFIFELKNYMDYSKLLILSSLLLKSGAAPFHFWFPGVMEGLTWSNNLILMTWQKIAPIMLISYLMIQNISIIILMSIIIGSLGGLNQTSLRKIMAFSSINHLGWMLAAMMSNEILWLMYFSMYTFLSFVLVYFFNLFKLFHINQMFNLFFDYKVIKFTLFMNLLSLGGLPPFLGFMPKWLVIQSLTINNQLFLITGMVMMTLITLYFYLRMCYSAFMLNYYENNWFMKNYFNMINMNFYLFLSFISLLGLPIISMVYSIF
uniref:NADH-ubiquinone oxidoreductase chain 2 n=1 Tax=Heterostomus curvipalpis TaxID=857307 RepID=A0A3G5FPQ2_9DIPT|nr:NADH dehydrogenase subunit 2 [Heterostomus curvipalpis]UDF83769.1 NADH dehydrogenase subunit 2 [Heterostomus curvipalpis]